MSLGKDFEISEDFGEDIIIPPTDLWSDEPPLESDLHRQQMQLLIESLEHLWNERNDFYIWAYISKSCVSLLLRVS